MWLAAMPCLALGPHEVLLLANTTSPDSVAVALKYARMRSVPAENLVWLSLPEEVVASPAAISPADFTRLIWDPANEAVRRRGLGHVLAWVYSIDFPVSVQTPETMSIQGATFVRNCLPAADLVKKGRYVSALYAGPDGRGSQEHFPQTFDVCREWLGGDMPLPSMMLGYTGEGGMSREEVLRCLERGAASDATRPAGTVYFVTNSDIRSACRQWQFTGAVSELRGLGCAAQTRPDLPAGRKDIVGLMTGTPWVNPWQGMGYLPGAMAEHLTSAAAIFHSRDQTKLTAWLLAGATVSAGTVCEPYSIWEKFPSARFYVHYASGCTAIESFYQAIRCPLQILLVGDPLACPWGERAELTMAGFDGETLSGKARLTARVHSVGGGHYGRCVYLLDGQVAGRDSSLTLDAAQMPPGEHRVRCVAYGGGLVRHQVFAEKRFLVERKADR
jgi:hypothetical protein